MNGQGYNYQLPRSPLDYGQNVAQPSGVVPPGTQARDVSFQDPSMKYRQSTSNESEDDGADSSEDSETDYGMSQGTQYTDLNDDDASSTTTIGGAGGASAYLAAPTQALPPTQPVDWQHVYAATRTRTLRKEDTLMSIDPPTIAEQVEERMLALVDRLLEELSNRQTQGTAAIQMVFRQCFLETQRDILGLKKEVVDLRLEVERLRNGCR